MNKVNLSIALGLLVASLFVLTFKIGMSVQREESIRIGRIERHNVVYSVKEIKEHDNDWK